VFSWDENVKRPPFRREMSRLVSLIVVPLLISGVARPMMIIGIHGP
jgi:hypothetical protein